MPEPHTKERTRPYAGEAVGVKGRICTDLQDTEGGDHVTNCTGKNG